MFSTYEMHKKTFNYRLEKELKKQHILVVTGDEKKLKSVRNIQQLCRSRPHAFIILLKEKKNSNKLYIKDRDDKLTEIKTNSSFQTWSADFYVEGRSAPCPQRKGGRNNEFLLDEKKLSSSLKNKSFIPNQSAFPYRTFIKKILFSTTPALENHECEKIKNTIAAMAAAEVKKEELPHEFTGHAAWVVKIKQLAKDIGQHRSNPYPILTKDVLSNPRFYSLLTNIVDHKIKENSSELAEEKINEPVFWQKVEKDDKNQTITLSNFSEHKVDRLGAHTIADDKIVIEYKNLNKTTFEGLFRDFDKTTEEYVRAEEFIRRCIERAGESDWADRFSGPCTKKNKIVVYLKVISNIYAHKKIDESFTATEKAILWDSHLWGYWKGRSAKTVHSFFHKTTVKEFDDDKIAIALGLKAAQKR